MTVTSIAANLLLLPASYVDPKGGLKPGVTAAEAETVATDIQTRADSLPPAQKALFLALVMDDSSQLAPAGGAPPSNLDQTLDRLQTAATSTSLASFLALGVDPAALAKAIILLADAENTDALNEQLSDIQQAYTDLMAQVGADQKSASDLKSGALTALILGLCAAVVSVAGGLVGLGGAGRALTKISKLTELSEVGEVGGKFGEDAGKASEDEFIENPLYKPAGASKPVGASKPPSPSRNDGAAPAGANGKGGADKPGDDFDEEDLPETPPPPLPVGLKRLDLFIQRIQGYTAILAGISTGLNAGATYASSASQADSKDADADAAQDAAEAQQVQAREAIAQTLQQGLTTLTSALMQNAKDLESSVSDLQQKIVG